MRYAAWRHDRRDEGRKMRELTPEPLTAFRHIRDNAADFGLNPYVAEPWHWSYNVVDE